MTRRKRFPADATAHDLLVPVLRGGRRVYDPPPLEQSRDLAREQLAQLHPSVKRFVNPHLYPVGLEPALYRRKTDLILRLRGEGGKG
jgi:nicotinate phosphoribosyltransferase